MDFYTIIILLLEYINLHQSLILRLVCKKFTFVDYNYFFLKTFYPKNFSCDIPASLLSSANRFGVHVSLTLEEGWIDIVNKINCKIRKLDLRYNDTQEFSTDLSAYKIFQDISDLTIYNSDVYNMHALKNAEYLRFIGVSFCGNIAQFAQLKKLHTLVLRDCLQITTEEDQNVYFGLDISLLQQALFSVLDLSNLHITDIYPLSKCANLHTLILTETLIDNLNDIVHFEKLRVLNISYTKITDLSPLKNTKIHTLIAIGVYGAKKFGCLKKMTSLNLSECMIKTMPVFKNVKTLVITDTLTKNLLYAKYCEKLEVLDLTRTKVSDIKHLVQCKNLHTLFLTGTDVTNITCLTQVKHLYISYTWVSQLPKSDNLITVEAESTQLQKIPVLKNVQILRVNHISNLVYIPNLPKLIKLEANYTNLKTLYKLKNLEELDIVCTQIRFIPKLPKLRKLRVSDNRIKNIDQLRDVHITIVS